MSENIQNDAATQFKITPCCRSENLNLMNLLKIKFELRYISEKFNAVANYFEMFA